MTFLIARIPSYQQLFSILMEEIGYPLAMDNKEKGGDDIHDSSFGWNYKTQEREIF
jgi:hypothetical protein